MKLLLLILLFALNFSFFIIPCQSSGSSVLGKGKSLSVEKFSEDVLVSDNGTFAAGFYDVGINAFCFAVWYANSREKTVVWMANRDKPVNGKMSQLSFRDSGDLVLTDAGGDSVWTTNTSSVKAAKVEILETGNLVIRDFGGNSVWESFEFPTDTLLPSQPLTKSKKLVSRRSEGVYTSGSFSFYFGDDNVLRFLFDSPDVSGIYWPDPSYDIFANGRTRYNKSRYAILDDVGHFISSDNLQFSASNVGPGIRRRMTMDYDGVLRLYSLNNGTGEWEVSWLPWLERCRVHGLCGENGICVYLPHAKCMCPPGYSIKNRNDWTQGCKADFSSSCNETGQQFVKLPNTDFYGYDAHYSSGIPFEACRNICSTDCSCRGFVYRNDGFGACYTKNTLLNGISTSANTGDFYIKLSSRRNISGNLVDQPMNCSMPSVVLLESAPTTISKAENYTLPLVFVLVIGIIEVICIAAGWVFLRRLNRQVNNIDKGYLALANGFKRFTYKELKTATNDFSEEIGRGGSGVVFKGILVDGRVVAVKKLERVNHGEMDFWSEVSIIGSIHHMNLVAIWGFCAERDKRLLVYEYMENGSLANNLFSNSHPLSWKHRFEIALGTAKGLSYLHEECVEWVLHCDIKPQNILLDKDFDSKVADFGLSKLLDRSSGDHASFSGIRGTRGYMAPEWVLNLPITSKVDVYSYGLVVLEMVTGKSPLGFQLGDESGRDVHTQLIPWIKNILKSKENWVVDLADPSLFKDYVHFQVEGLVKIALRCTEEEMNARPTMREVVDYLTSCSGKDRA